MRAAPKLVSPLVDGPGNLAGWSSWEVIRKSQRDRTGAGGAAGVESEKE